MIGSQVLKQFSDKGIDFEIHGDKLKVIAPKGSVTPELKQLIETSKQTIMTAIQEYAANIEPSSGIAKPSGPCPRCGSGWWYQEVSQSWMCIKCHPDPKGDYIKGVLAKRRKEKEL